MSLFTATFSVDPLALDIDGVKAGNAAEMELRLQQLIDGSSEPLQILDMVLAGVEEGPKWEATLVFADAGSPALARGVASVYAAVAGNKTEAYGALLSRLLVANALLAIQAVHKTEVAGGGDGSNFMALALVEQAP